MTFVPHLYMLVGVPGAGKTTWIREHIQAGKRPCAVLSTDDIIDGHAKLEGLTYNETFRDLIGFADKALYMRLRNILIEDPNQDIYWDQTNLTRKSRLRKLSKFAELKREADRLYHEEPVTFRKVAVVFTTPLGVCIDRRSGDGEFDKKVDAEVIKEMHQDRFENPSLGEGFQAIYNCDEKGLALVSQVE